MNDIILVNEKDEVAGYAKKLDVHQKGLLHRAFSVFIYKKQGDGIAVLLQQRHANKYHSASLWTNTCCSHPRPGEEIKEAAPRRLQEEMGIDAVLKEAGVFHYHTKVGNGLIENEIDHVFVGEFLETSTIQVDEKEVMNYQWMDIKILKKDLSEHPERYTAWLAEALEVAEKIFPLANKSA